MKAKVLLSLLVVLLVAANADASLRAYWAFDEGSGDYALDSSGNGNTGLLYADTVAGDPAVALPGPTTIPDRIVGVHGGALQFCAGANNYNCVMVAKSDSIKTLGSSWSFAMWLRQDSRAGSPGGGAGYQRVISCPNYEIELGVPGWEYDYFWPYSTELNGEFDVDIGTDYIGAGGHLGEWYHMAVTYDGRYLKKYLNGTLVPNSVKDINSSLHNVWDDPGWVDAVLKLGSQTWPNKDWLRGAMDDVAIYGDQCLTPAQIAGLYNGSLTPLNVPEPGTLVLLVCGALGLLLRRWW